MRFSPLSRSAPCSCLMVRPCLLGSAGRLYRATKGRLIVDEGARRAVQKDGRSLLPIGVVEVEGVFSKGDVVALCDVGGEEFARGLTNYSAADARRVRRLHTERISEVLGRLPYEEIIHRDNLVVIAGN